MLPAVVLANRSPVGPSAYRRECATLTIPCKDTRFELRRTKITRLNGTSYMRWVPWRVGISAPFRVYDVYPSSSPRETEADLMAWIAERGGVYA